MANCAYLTTAVLDAAAASPASLKSFVARAAEVAQPEQGWIRFLKVIPRVAAASWMEGELQVDFAGDDKGTTVSFYSVLGVGIRERLFSPFYLVVPIDEFQRAVVLTPDIVAPLRAHQGLNRLTLAQGLRVRNKDIPDFELEDKAMGDSDRITAPPPALAIADPDEPLE
jgi:hypothetical protein